MPGIFINYRRMEAGACARGLSDALSLGDRRVSADIRDLQRGTALDGADVSADVLQAMIRPHRRRPAGLRAGCGALG